MSSESLPLLHSCVINNDIVRLIQLLSSNRDIDVDLDDENLGTPLRVAISRRNYEMVKILLENGADVNKKFKGCPLLHIAVKGSIRYNHILKLLLEHGADTYLKDNEGYSVLSRAVRNNLTLAVKTLCEMPNIPINMGDDLGNTPLHLSMAFNAGTTAILVKSPNIDVNIKNLKGETPLHHLGRIANLFGETPSHVEICRIINSFEPFAPKFDINAQDLNGDTPMHAIRKNFNEGLAGVMVERMETIFAETLDSSKRNNDGLTYKDIFLKIYSF